MIITWLCILTAAWAYLMWRVGQLFVFAKIQDNINRRLVELIVHLGERHGMVGHSGDGQHFGDGSSSIH